MVTLIVVVHDRNKKIKMSDYDGNGMLFTVVTRGYFYKIEYTEENLLQRETEQTDG